MTREDKIYAYMRSDEYVPLRFDELMAVLDVPRSDADELASILDTLISKGRIIITKKQRYMPVSKADGIAAGTLSCNAKGFFGFLLCEDGNDVFIRGNDMANAIHGDKVLVRIDSGESSYGKREGHVTKVLERGLKNIVGIITEKKGALYRMRPDDRRIYKSVRIHPDNLCGAVSGDRVSVEITEINAQGKIFGRVLAVLGQGHTIKSRIDGMIISNNIKREFDPDTAEEALAAPSEVTGRDTKSRLDLRSRLIFTIDGDDARDFDDAVSLDICGNGNYYLGVHIADVTHYVREGSALDREAYERAASVYLADRVIPMLPERLSNGICSLNPNADRLALSVFMEIDHDGNVVSHSLERSVINSKYRMTYKDATAIIEKTDPELRSAYAPIADTLDKMSELSDILSKKRDSRGAIDFDFPETYIEVDDEGHPTDIDIAERGVSNRLIESFMLCANETIAEYAFWAELPFVYRVHEAPSTDKLTHFARFISPFGLRITERIDSGEPIHPKSLQTILDRVKDTAEERIVSLEMLHSLMKAEYSAENKGHFGLAAKYYCHFTSPIRRYPDLMIHRILKEFIDGRLTDTRAAHFAALTPETASHSSERETAAEHTERDVEELMKAAYMSNFIGSRFKAVVSNVTGFGMFVQLKNTVEGLIRLENMDEDYFDYSETSSALIGQFTGITYKAGDPVNVILVSSDTETNKIDFILAQDLSPELLQKFYRNEERASRMRAKREEQPSRGRGSVFRAGKAGRRRYER